MPISDTTLSHRPAELLQRLVRFDTSNPPGNERDCILWIGCLLEEAGLEPIYLARTPERPNLIARLKGEGSAPPLLLYGHVDVVTTAGQRWSHPPFEGRMVDGFVWGRGALDMKSGVAMMLSAVLKARAEGQRPPGDVIFSAMADEEAGGEFGAKYLVEQHPGLFQGVRYALSEFGGFNLSIGGVRFYPVQVAEKQTCWMKLTFRGQGGHGSMPVRGGAMAGLSHALQVLDRRSLPVHVTPPVKLMMDSLSGGLPGLTGRLLGQITNPALTDMLLKLLGERARIFAPLFHNTVCPTILQASDKINVIPSEVALQLDGRLLPGLRSEQMVAELCALLGGGFDIEILQAEPGPTEADMALFGMLSGVLRELDPAGKPIPYVNAAVTDARYLSRLGIQTYGFTPLKLPDDFNFVNTIHAADERVPIEALEFGAQAVYRVMEQFQ